MKHRIALALVMCIAAPPAVAHTFGMHDGGFIAGLMHPLSGVDHLLAMFAVGLWASQLGGRALWAVPLAFTGMLVPGGVIGMWELELPFAETLIALSVLTLGLMLRFTVRLPAALGMLLVGLFALLHGHAHGMVLPHAATPLFYGMGFVIVTVILHGLGIATGILMQRQNGPNLVRVPHIGTAITFIGALLVM